jgi:hypothetical protein
MIVALWSAFWVKSFYVSGELVLMIGDLLGADDGWF